MHCASVAAEGRPGASSCEDCGRNDVLRTRALRTAATREHDGNDEEAKQIQSEVKQCVNLSGHRACCDVRVVHATLRTCRNLAQIDFGGASTGHQRMHESAEHMQTMMVMDLRRFLRDVPVEERICPSRRHREQDHTRASRRAFEALPELANDGRVRSQSVKGIDSRQTVAVAERLENLESTLRLLHVEARCKETTPGREKSVIR